MQDQQQRGSVTDSQLRALAESGIIRRTDLIWREGMYEWVEARRLVGLFPPEPVAIAPPLPPALPLPLPSPRRDERGDEEQPSRRRKKRRTPWNWLVIGVAVVALCALVPVFAVVGVYFLSEQQIGQQFGQRIGCNGRELYYTPRAPKAEAERLCDYLVTCGFFNGDLKSVQIDKKGRWYQVRRNPPLRRPLHHA